MIFVSATGIIGVLLSSTTIGILGEGIVA